MWIKCLALDAASNKVSRWMCGLAMAGDARANAMREVALASIACTDMVSLIVAIVIDAIKC